MTAAAPLAAVYVDFVTRLYHSDATPIDNLHECSRSQAELLGAKPCPTCWFGRGGVK